MPLEIIGVDADDTLWHTETVFRLTHKRFNELLGDFADEDTLEAKLAAVERENMKSYGYGAKGFTLSMLQTALEISDGKVSTNVIRELLDARVGRCESGVGLTARAADASPAGAPPNRQFFAGDSPGRG